MDSLQIFFALTFTHLITDFLLQGWGIGPHKYGLNRYMLAHLGITAIGIILPLVFFHLALARILLALAIILLSHLAIDVVRPYLHRRWHITPDNGLFWQLLGIDQILHLTVLYLLSATILS